MSWLLAPLRLAWAVYAWLVFALLAFAATLAVLVVPGLQRRRRVARAIARSIFTLIGIRPQVQGALPEPPGVVIANHASYIDGVLLTAILPADFAFVIKHEMAKVPLAGLLLSRIGSHFVDRHNRHMSGLAMRRLLRAAAGGEALAFFPEGTFEAEPGLRRFHSGAFVTAVKGGLPVWPVVIRGTRRMLPARRILARPARLEVEVLAPIAPDSEAAANAISLRDETRRRIAAVLGEADLHPPPPAHGESRTDADRPAGAGAPLSAPSRPGGDP